MGNIDDSINRRIYELRYGKFKDAQSYREEVAREIEKEFGVRLTGQAVKRRLQRYTKPKKTKTQGDVVEVERGRITARATSHGSQIKSLKELLVACDIDQTEWEVVSYAVKKWDGYLPGGAVMPMFSVSANLKRTTLPEPLWPPIRPIIIEDDFSRKALSENRSIKRAIIIHDAHVGFTRQRDGSLKPMHDRRALDVVLQIVERVQPDIVIVAGDWFDLSDWSDRFIRTPDMANLSNAAFREGGLFFARLRKLAPSARIIYMQGNHEKRMDDAIARNVSAAYDLRPIDDPDGPHMLSLARVLDLASMDIEYLDEYPDCHFFLNDNLLVEHGTIVRSGSGDTVKTIIRDARVSTYVGHIHRQESATKTSFSSRGPIGYKAMSGGCLCHIDGRVPASKGRNNWKQGFGVIYFEDGNGHFADTLVSIDDGYAIFEGVPYKWGVFYSES